MLLERLMEALTLAGVALVMGAWAVIAEGLLH